MSEDIGAGFAARLPKTWFAGPPQVSSDSEEILVIGDLPDVELAGGTAPEARAAARVARIDRFREETRDERVKIAREAERRFRRKVAWGARCGEETRAFTTLSLPVMTRLRMPERAILDTLVAGGGAPRRRGAPPGGGRRARGGTTGRGEERPEGVGTEWGGRPGGA